MGTGGLLADRLKIFTLSSREALGNEIRALDREELTLVLDEVCARACAIRVKTQLTDGSGPTKEAPP